MAKKTSSAAVMQERTAYGSVKIYVRHSNCPETKSDVACGKCSFWIYAHPKGEAARRSTLTTPSKSEAWKLASDILRGFDPEISAARRAEEQAKENLTTILDAVNLYIYRRDLDGERTRALYRSLLGNKLAKALAKAKIEYIQHVTTPWLREWYQSKEWDYAPTTQRQRWGVIRCFFGFLFDQKVVSSDPARPIKAAKTNGHYNNIPYNDEQVEAILKAAEDRRLYLFIQILRWTGMDNQDAMMFRPTMIIDGVLSYHRQKTGKEAVIPLQPEMLALLPELLTLPGEMPFRRQAIKLDSDATAMYREVKAAITKAGITEMQFRQEDGTTTIHTPTVKAFRHTFCVWHLQRGYKIETVAKMMGDNPETVRKAYAVWTKGRNDAFIAEVRAMQEALAAKAVPLTTQDEKRVTVQ
jgi:integrase